MLAETASHDRGAGAGGKGAAVRCARVFAAGSWCVYRLMFRKHDRFKKVRLFGRSRCACSRTFRVGINQTCRLKQGQVRFRRNVDDSLVAEVRLLAHPQILNVCGRDAAVLDADSLGGAFRALMASAWALSFSASRLALACAMRIFLFCSALANSALPSISWLHTLYQGRINASATMKSTRPATVHATPLTGAWGSRSNCCYCS